ncbi:MAG TPA: hypothetical protein VK614_10485 [Allosphingosinicella sp.]|nr:hypothetical protein [Allosphingosinicella sp.]
MSDTDAPANEERLRAAIGPRADYYLRRWRAMDSGGKKPSWNWPACLLNVFWFAYRKMWGPMAAMALAYVITAPFLDPTHKPYFMIAAFSLVGLSFVTGGFGNLLYLRQVEKLVASPATLEQLRARGGVSLAAAIAAFVGVTVLSLVAGMIPALLARGG